MYGQVERRLSCFKVSSLSLGSVRSDRTCTFSIGLLAWRSKCGLFMPQRLSVLSSLTTIVFRQLVCFVVTHICPKAIRKAPTLSVCQGHTLCALFSIRRLLISHRPSLSFCHPRRHPSYHRRKDSTATPRLPRSCISGVPKDRFRKDTLHFVISVYIPAPRYFPWSFSAQNTAITRPNPPGRPCDEPPPQTASSRARPTYPRRPRSQSVRYGSQGRWDQMGMPIVPKGSPCQRLHPYR